MKKLLRLSISAVEIKQIYQLYLIYIMSKSRVLMSFTELLAIKIAKI